MNRNEFYKQLMSEYTFDAEKIRENAKRGKKRQKLQPMYIGMTAAAAACVVTVGTIAATNLGRNDGVSLTDSGLTTLSASDRLNHALAQLEEERSSTESKDFLVTFSAALSPAQAQQVLTAEGNIPVKQLYLADGSRISDATQIGRIFTEGTQLISGAAVYCSGSVAAQLQDDPAVFLIEAMQESDFENAAPVNIDDIQTSEVTLPEPAVTDPVISEPSVSTDPVQEPSLDGTSEPTADTSEMDGTAEPDDASDPLTEEDEGLPTEEVTTPVPEETTPAEPDNTTPPADTSTAGSATDEPAERVPELPAGVTLPADIAPEYTNTYITADTAFFISSDVFLSKNESGIELYRWDGYNQTLLCCEDLEDAKIAWVSENGRSLMLTGYGEHGTRSRTLLVSADNESITDLHTEDIVMSGTLTGFGFNSANGVLTLSIKDDGVYYITTARLNGDSLDFIDTIVQSESKVSLAAANGDTIYYAETVSGVTSIYAADVYSGSGRLVISLDDSAKLTRNLAFTHAVFTMGSGSTEIFDPVSEKLIPVSAESISFGAGRHSFLADNMCYVVANGTVSADGSISSLASVEYRRSGSEKWYAYVSGNAVKITSSVYSAQNKSGMLSFSTVTENVGSGLKTALRNAIGMNNALALGTCRDNGITTQQELIDSINVCYSANAAQKLMTRCGITPGGSLDYSSGGLEAIDAGSVILVISEKNEGSAAGMMYVEAGSFGGRTAYRCVSVSFVRENGGWRLNNIF